MKKPKKNIGLASLGGLVFSTDPNAVQKMNEGLEEGLDEIRPSDQDLRIWLDRKNRKGKAVTLIQGFECSDDVLKGLAKKLKSACGVGGAAKNDEIVIQGDHRKKVLEMLQKDGYKVKLAGG